MNEVMKGLISLVIAFSRLDSGHAPMYDMTQAAGSRGRVTRLRRLWRDVFSPDCWKLSIPAILYGAFGKFQLLQGKDAYP